MDQKTNDFSQSKSQQSKVGNGGHRHHPDLSEDLREVRESISRTASHVKDKAKDKAEDLFKEVKEGTANLQHTLSTYVKENPTKAIGFALLSGFIAAILLRK